MQSSVWILERRHRLLPSGWSPWRLSEPYRAYLDGDRAHAAASSRRGAIVEHRAREYRPVDDLMLYAGPLALDRLSRAVTVYGDPRRLSPLSFALLEHLLLAPAGEPVAAAELEGLIWGVPGPRSNRLVVAIYALRQALAGGDPTANFIETVTGQGYRVRRFPAGEVAP